VVVQEVMLGETPCSVAITKDSDLIQDGRIEFTFCLPDGREKRKVVDLHGRKPTNPLVEWVAAPVWLVGLGLLWLVGEEADKEDVICSRKDETQREDLGKRLYSALAGLGRWGSEPGCIPCWAAIQTAFGSARSSSISMSRHGHRSRPRLPRLRTQGDHEKCGTRGVLERIGQR